MAAFNVHSLFLSFALLLTGAINWAANAQYKAAGMLPYATSSTGELYFLVGVSSVHGNKASDFGGYKEKADNDSAEITAAREACEELIFIWDDTASFEKLLSERLRQGKNFDLRKQKSKTFELALKKLRKHARFSSHNGYQMHFAKVSLDHHLPAKFLARKNYYNTHLPLSWNETVKLQWIQAKKIFQALDNRRGMAAPVIIDGCTLYEPFLQSLQAARSQGIIAQL